MKINNAYTIIENRLAGNIKNSEKRIYKTLIGALGNLKERDMTRDQLQSVEEAIDGLGLEDADRVNVRKFRSRHNRFLKDIRKILSLIPEGHYMALGLCFGVAFGGVISSLFQGFSGAPQSVTGLGIGIGLIAGYIVGTYLDIEAIKQNRVLETQAR